MDKVFNLKNEKFNLAFEVKYFSFGTPGEHSSLAALAEVTNLGSTPLTISSFNLKIGEAIIKNTTVNASEIIDDSGELYALETLSGKVFFSRSEELDVIAPLNRPYLRQNESALGMLLFVFPEHKSSEKLIPTGLDGTGIFIEVKIAGYDIAVSDRIL